MQIETDRVVTFHYTLAELDGLQIETSRDGDPILYLHGRQGILEALQEALEGKAIGDSVDVSVPPERAYGLRRDGAQTRVPIKHVSGGHKKQFLAGQVVTVNTPKGEVTATVIKAGKFNLDVDTNHPLAGKHLVFHVEILGVREALDEELAHGHAHGPGGHQH